MTKRFKTHAEEFEIHHDDGNEQAKLSERKNQKLFICGKERR